MTSQIICFGSFVIVQSIISIYIVSSLSHAKEKIHVNLKFALFGLERQDSIYNGFQDCDCCFNDASDPLNLVIVCYIDISIREGVSEKFYVDCRVGIF